jgi:hypothetical protein
MTRLWETDHPYYGSDVNENECESFAGLRAAVDGIDEGMNHVYRWDWQDWSQPHHDSLFLDGEDRSKQTFTVYLVLPRKTMLINFTCPVTHEDEADVLAWLRSDRILGALRKLWEPILDPPAEH